jgi:hypothetical protein
VRLSQVVDLWGHRAPGGGDCGGWDGWLGIAVVLLGPALMALTLTLLFNK